jgi:DNA-binding transcriptional ArsR family regulator
MSVEAHIWALNVPTKDLPQPSERHLLLILANYADANGGSVFPSIKRLQQQTGYSRRTIYRALDALKKAKLIKTDNPAIVAAHITRADRRPTCYRLSLK